MFVWSPVTNQILGTKKFGGSSLWKTYVDELIMLTHIIFGSPFSSILFGYGRCLHPAEGFHQQRDRAGISTDWGMEVRIKRLKTFNVPFLSSRRSITLLGGSQKSLIFRIPWLCGLCGLCGLYGKANTELKNTTWEWVIPSISGKIDDGFSYWVY